MSQGLVSQVDAASVPGEGAKAANSAAAAAANPKLAQVQGKIWDAAALRWRWPHEGAGGPVKRLPTEPDGETAGNLAVGAAAGGAGAKQDRVRGSTETECRGACGNEEREEREAWDDEDECVYVTPKQVRLVALPPPRMSVAGVGGRACDKELYCWFFCVLLRICGNVRGCWAMPGGAGVGSDPMQPETARVHQGQGQAYHRRRYCQNRLCWCAHFRCVWHCCGVCSNRASRCAMPLVMTAMSSLLLPQEHDANHYTNFPQMPNVPTDSH